MEEILKPPGMVLKPWKSTTFPSTGAGSLNHQQYLENIVYHFLRQLWLFLGVKLMEIHSNGCFPGRSDPLHPQKKNTPKANPTEPTP